MLQKMFNHRVFEDPCIMVEILPRPMEIWEVHLNICGNHEGFCALRSLSLQSPAICWSTTWCVDVKIQLIITKSKHGVFPTSVKCKGMPDPHLSFGLRRHGCLAQQLSRLTQIGEYVISFHFCVYLRIAETLWDALNCKQPMPLYAISADCGCSRAVLVR